MNRQDDPALDGDLMLYRRIPPSAERVTWDASGRPIPSSQNFSDSEQELSVHIANETTPEAMLSGHEGFGLVYLMAKDFREIYTGKNVPLAICRDDKEPENGHVLVCGKPTPKMKKDLRDRAKWVPGRWPARIPPEPSAESAGQA
jgi:hypothetical protein